MSFDQDKLERSVEQSSGIFNKYVYETSDTIEEIQAFGYFAKSKFARYDNNQTNSKGWMTGVIEAQCSDGYAMGILDGSTGTLTVILSQSSIVSPASQVVVQQPSDLEGELDSNKYYLIDGDINMGDIIINIPEGGLSIGGLGSSVSRLFSNSNNYTMFNTSVSGTSNLVISGLEIEVSGTLSSVYNVKSSGVNGAVVFDGIRYTNCSSLGVIDGFFQGVETLVSRVGGTPDLTLDGSWAGGFRSTQSIAIGFTSAFTTALFRKGASLSMAGRFLTDISADLSDNCALFDFEESNFPNSSTIQVSKAIISRNGVYSSDDATVTPNITSSSLACMWKDNLGLDNTYVGGRSIVTTAVATVIGGVGAFVDALGTTTASNLEHFEQSANWTLKHLGSSPVDFTVSANLFIEGLANNEVAVKILKWDDSEGVFVTVGTQTRQINSLVGMRDIGIFELSYPVVLDKNDYVKLQIANNTILSNLTVELDSFINISER